MIKGSSKSINGIIFNITNGTLIVYVVITYEITAFKYKKHII